jgi:hypothetical protein
LYVDQFGSLAGTETEQYGFAQVVAVAGLDITPTATKARTLTAVKTRETDRILVPPIHHLKTPQL